MPHDYKTYIWINPERVDAAKTAKDEVEGIDFIIELSPYDAPQAITGCYDEDSGRFTIAFEYIDDEPGKAIKATGGVGIFAGVHSGKILSIVLHIDKPPLDRAAVIQLRTNVLDALGQMPSKKDRGGWNREITKELLEEDFEKLTGELVSAN